MIFYKITDGDCLIQGAFSKSSHPGIPVFFDNNGIIEVFSNYLIIKSIKSTDQATSVITYADQLLTFLRFLELKGNGITWRQVTDAHLVEFRDKKINSGLKSSYVAGVLRTVFDFYVWAELNKNIRHHIAIYNDDKEYAISALKTKTSWKWPHIPSSISKAKPTPTNEDLEKLHITTIQESEKVGVRDALIFTIYERSARRMEALQIKVSDIPDWDEIEEYLGSNKIFYVAVMGKGRRERDLELLPETMGLLREYIENERNEAVQAAKKRNKFYGEPTHLFVSSTTGKALNKQYISRRLSGLMKKAGVDGTGHRVRAKGLTDIVAAFDGFDYRGQPKSAQDVLIRAAEKAGHSNPQSLRYYLALSRSEGLAAKLNNVELLRSLELKVAILKKQVSRVDEASALFKAIINDVNVESELLSYLRNFFSKTDNL
ncbi:tyrosine-type recombinase/integrase [Rheinheimera faecalis]